MYKDELACDIKLLSRQEKMFTPTSVDGSNMFLSSRHSLGTPTGSTTAGIFTPAKIPPTAGKPPCTRGATNGVGTAVRLQTRFVSSRTEMDNNSREGNLDAVPLQSSFCMRLTRDCAFRDCSIRNQVIKRPFLH